MKRLSLLLYGLLFSVVAVAQRYREYRYFDDGSDSDMPEIEPIGYLFLAIFALIIYVIYLACRRIKESIAARRKETEKLGRYKVYRFNEACIGGVTRSSICIGEKRVALDKKLNDGFVPTYIGEDGYYNLADGEYIIKRRGIFYYKVIGCPLIYSQDIVTLFVKRRTFRKYAKYANFKVSRPEKLAYEWPW